MIKNLSAAKRQKIRSFAVRWRSILLKDNIFSLESVKSYMCEECKSLGFVTDLGETFCSTFGKTLINNEELENILNDITDINQLGSVIYSLLNYSKYWDNKGSEILESLRKIFITGLNRLRFLANPLPFEGKPDKIKIVSDFILEKSQKNIIRQQILINRRGRIKFTEFIYDDISLTFKTLEDINYKIEKEIAVKVLNTVSNYFIKVYDDETSGRDIGAWMLSITNIENKTFNYKGAFGTKLVSEGVNLSEIVRKAVNMPDIMVFSKNNCQNKINKITIYHHFRLKKSPTLTSETPIILEYKNKFIIDRHTQSILINQKYVNGKVAHKYKLDNAITDLLDKLDSNTLLKYTVGNPNDIIKTKHKSNNYKIVIDFENRPRRIAKGSFDKYGLPIDYPLFIQTINDFISYYGLGDLFNPQVYGKAKRRKDDYIYCSVKFEGTNFLYNYIADTDEFSVGDNVIVPVGEKNQETVAEIIKIDYYTKNTVPYPLDKTKHIIRNCADKKDINN